MVKEMEMVEMLETPVLVGCTFIMGRVPCGEPAQPSGLIGGVGSYCPDHSWAAQPVVFDATKRCRRCDEPRRFAAIIGEADGSWEHVDCDATSKDELKPLHGICPECWTERSAAGGCECD